MEPQHEKTSESMIKSYELLELFHISQETSNYPTGHYKSDIEIFYPVSLKDVCDDPKVEDYIYHITKAKRLYGKELVIPYSSNLGHIFDNREKVRKLFIGPVFHSIMAWYGHIPSLQNCQTSYKGVWCNDHIYKTYEECLQYCTERNK